MRKSGAASSRAAPIITSAVLPSAKMSAMVAQVRQQFAYSSEPKIASLHGKAWAKLTTGGRPESFAEPEK